MCGEMSDLPYKKRPEAGWRVFVLAGGVFFFGYMPSAAADLALKEGAVIDLVVQRNLGVKTERVYPQIADTDITKTKSQFDTKVSGQAYYNLDRSDKETIVLGTDNREVLYEAKVEKKFPQGVQGAIRVTNIHNQTNSAFATDPRFFDSSIQFDAQAPMLRNRFGKSDQLSVKLSEAQKKVVESGSLNAIQDRVAGAVRNYWNWVASKEYVELANRFLKLALDFQERTDLKKNLGLAEDTDLFATEALVQERQAETLRAKNLLEDLKQRLNDSLDFNLDTPLSTSEALGVRGQAMTSAEGMELALQRRPDYQALLDEAKVKDIQIAIDKDQKWPSLDLVSSLQLNSVDPDYGAALKQTFLAEHPEWLIGARFQIEIENRLAKANLKKSELEKIQVLLRIKELENSIALEVDERVRELALQRKELEKYSNAAVLQRKKMEGEMAKFALGRSDSDTIIRFQGDYLDASRRALEAKVRLQLAWVELRRSTATLWNESGEVFDERPR